MKLIDPSIEILSPINGEEILKHLEIATRTCYNSLDKVCEGSDKKLLKTILDSHHYSCVEHISLTVKVKCSRSTMAQWTRHRLMSYSVQSQRYVRYADRLKLKNWDEDLIVSLYNEGFSCKKISNMSEGKYSESKINLILKKFEIKKRPLGNTGITNSDYFSKIDTPEKAYMLGIIQTDGNINLANNMVSITQKNGWYIKKLIEDFIRPEVKTGKDRDCDKFYITSPQIVKDLISHGIVPDKSHKMTKEDADKLMTSVKGFEYDFLRGMMDGDGNIRFFMQKTNTFSCNIGFAGNEFLIKNISDFIMSDLNYNTNIRQDAISKVLFRIHITKPSIALELCRRMYKNFVFPYGNPIKTERGLEHIDHDFKISNISKKDRVEMIAPEEKLFHKKAIMWDYVEALENAADTYTKLIELGTSQQDARGVLPNATATVMIVSANLRSWREFLQKRTDKSAQSEIRFLATEILNEFKSKIPVIFDDIGE